MSVNQILVICLIAELVVFLVVLGRMAATAISVLKEAKKLAGNAQGLVDSSKKAVEDGKIAAKDTAAKLLENATTLEKAAGILALVSAALNFKEVLRKGTPLGRGRIGAFFDRRNRKKAEKELRKTKKEISKMRKANKKEAKQSRKASKMARKLRKKK